MGLDQNLYAVSKDASLSDINDYNKRSEIEDFEEIGYWRKHANLQGYVASLAEKRLNIKPDDFNCVAIELTEEDVLAIIECSKIESFGEYDGTTGFFFGETYAGHHEQTIKVMETALQYIKDGKKIVYDSNW